MNFDTLTDSELREILKEPEATEGDRRKARAVLARREREEETGEYWQRPPTEKRNHRNPRKTKRRRVQSFKRF